MGAAGMAPSAPAPIATAPSTTAYVQERSPAAYSQPAPMSYPAPAPAVTGDSSVARRAAIALALTIPFVGLPVGWVFMMIEDRNKQAIGRVCAVWSMIGLVLHLILTYFMIQGTVKTLAALLPQVMAGAAASRRASPGGLNE